MIEYHTIALTVAVNDPMTPYRLTVSNFLVYSHFMFLRIRPQNVIYNHYKRDEGQDGIYNEVNKEMVNLVLLNEGDSRIGRQDSPMVQRFNHYL